MKRAPWTSITLAALLLVGLPASPASAQTLSPGCQAVISHTGFFGDHYAGFSLSGKEFFANEKITVTASTPTSVATPTTVRLTVGDAFVDTTPFPGTLSYTFPADITTSVIWNTEGGNATWTATCATPPTSAEECKKGGWEAFAFENQGDCVRFVTTDR